MGQRSWARGEPLELIEMPTPEPRPRQLRVAVKAASVNPVDWKMREGNPLGLAARLVGPPPPVVFGVDFAGVVDAVGSRVTDVKVGDAVVGGTDFSRGQRGTFADTVFVEPHQVAVLPAGFDLDVACTLPVAGVTSWMALVEMANVQPGEKVLVLGASGAVGQFCVQVAAGVCGASVVGVCSERNAELVRGLGAQQVLDYGKGDALAQARAFGRFKAIVDCAGGYSGARCRAMLGPGGRHIMVAGDTPAAFVQVVVPPFTSRAILGVATRTRLNHLVQAISAGKITVNIARRFPLAAVEEALALSKSGRLTGKLVLNP